MTTPTDYYAGPNISPTELVLHAQRAHDLTQIPQRIHDHPAGARCRDGCWVVGG